MADQNDTADNDDLTARGATLVESFVSFLRDRSVRPLRSAIRMTAFGLVIAVVGVVALVVIVIAILRLLDADVFGGRAWITDVLIGVVLIGAGLISLRKGLHPRSEP